MCNRFQNKQGWSWGEAFSHGKIPLRFPDSLPNLREEFRPTDDVAIVRPVDADKPADGFEAASVRWDLVPASWRQPLKAKTFLATNARSETVATTPAFRGAFARRRCLIPADAFFEWTGPKGAKRKWLITVPAEPLFCFAGLWDHAQTADGPVSSCSILTTAAGPDMSAIHHRQPVIVPQDRWLDWLDLAGDPTPLYAPGSPGTLRLEPAPAEQGLLL